MQRSCYEGEKNHKEKIFTSKEAQIVKKVKKES